MDFVKFIKIAMIVAQHFSINIPTCKLSNLLRPYLGTCSYQRVYSKEFVYIFRENYHCTKNEEILNRKLHFLCSVFFHGFVNSLFTDIPFEKNSNIETSEHFEKAKKGTGSSKLTFQELPSIHYKGPPEVATQSCY